ncbi:CECR6/TMEM121 family [Cinara cedri]|uniref:CECR6/TMEM121 family n=1 Tax=Cinara cedri TaxID=506608 RepID=A0A5E4NE99_9HEMI|nr:CECR6/TMEM121 family [Cinara cedri]
MNKMRMVFVLDAGVLLALQLVQLFSLDFYVWIVFRGTWYSRYPNSVFVALNLVLTVLFYHTFLNSYKEYRYRQTQKADFETPSSVQSKTKKYPVYLNCITWGVYVIILFIKIVLIFSNNVVSLISYNNFMGPQMLKLLIGLSGIIFYLLVNAECVGRQLDREKWVTNSWIIEIFDSVELLSIIISTNHQIGHVPYLIYTLTFANFMLPLWILYSISQPDIDIKPMGLPQPVCYNFLHLILVQMPFLGIRLYMWVVFNHNASVFIMKNLLHIILFLHSLYPHIIEISKKNQYSPESFFDEANPEIILTNRRHEEPAEVF